MMTPRTPLPRSRCGARSAGNDGPLADAASFVAIDEDKISGAILITCLPAAIRRSR